MILVPPPYCEGNLPFDDLLALPTYIEFQSSDLSLSNKALLLFVREIARLLSALDPRYVMPSSRVMAR